MKSTCKHCGRGIVFEQEDRSKFDLYLNAVAVTHAARPEWRSGQAFFNTLHMIRPEWSGEFRGGVLDPFHRDDVLPAFLARVRGLFEAEETVRVHDDEEGQS